MPPEKLPNRCCGFLLGYLPIDRFLGFLAVSALSKSSSEFSVCTLFLKVRSLTPSASSPFRLDSDFIFLILMRAASASSCEKMPVFILL